MNIRTLGNETTVESIGSVEYPVYQDFGPGFYHDVYYPPGSKLFVRNEHNETVIHTRGVSGAYSVIAEPSAHPVRSRIPKYVYHMRMLGRDFTIPPQLEGLDGLGQPIYRNWSGPIRTPISVLGIIPDLQLIDVKKEALEAFNSFTEQIPDETSLPNFLLEIGEVKELAVTCTKWRELFTFFERQYFRFLANASPFRKGKRLRTLRDVEEFLRNGLLQYSFGIKPLISDIKAFVTVGKKVQARLKYLRSVNGRRRRVRFGRELSLSPSDFQPVIQPIGSGLSWKFQVVNCNAMFHASAECISELDLSGADAFSRGVTNALGFDNPASVIWNAIPYSFVLEYFANVKSFLDRLEIEPYQGHWDVFNVCHSISCKVGISVYLVRGIEETYLGGLAVDHYFRAPGLPADFFSLQLTDPTAQQQLLIAALLDQKVRK